MTVSEHPTTVVRLRGLLDVARFARSGADVVTLLERLAATISESLGWQSVSASVYRPAWDDFRVELVHGGEPTLGETRTREEWDGLLEQARERRGAYRGRGTSFHVPLRHTDGTLLGVVSVDERANGGEPSDEELDVLVAVCAHAGHALDAARAARDAERHRRALEQLLDVSSQLARGEAVLDTVCAAIRNALGFDRVAVFIADEAADHYSPAAACGWKLTDPGLAIAATVAETQSLFDPAFELEGCYVVDQESAHERIPEEHRSSFVPESVGRGERAWRGHWVLVPILDGKGYIWVDEPRDRLLPSRGRLQALRLFANQATAVIEYQQHVQALRTSEARKSAILESALDCVITIDHEGRIVEFNPEAEETFGWTSDEAMGRELAELLVAPGRDRRRLADYFSTGMAAIVGKRLEFLAIRSNGKEFPVEVGVSKVKLPGAPLYTATLRDISKRRRAEDRLREAEAKYRTLVEHIPLVTYVNTLGLPVRTLYISPQIEGMLGYPRDDWLTDDFFPQLLHPDDRERVMADVKRTHEHGEAFRGEYRLLAADGREVWVLDETQAVEEESGTPIYLQGFLLDITDQRAAEEARRHSEELYRLVVEGSQDSISLVDTTGTFLYASPSNRELLGYEPGDLVGTSFAAILHPDDLEHVRDNMRSVLRDGSAPPTRARVRAKSGEWRPIEGRASCVRDAEGEPQAIIVVGRDLTERERLEDQLRQAQKMEAIGNLAGGIAHDFNNLLTAIGGYSEFIVGDESAGDSARRSAGQIARATERATGLTRQLLAFSRKQVLSPTVLDLNGVVADVEKMLRRVIGEHIVLETRLDAKLGDVRADRGQLEQVLLNLAVNARDAMPSGGALTIETADVELDEAFVAQHVDLTPGPYAMLAVSDNGQGIDADTRERVFEPFFTTKPAGKGTGLGLATVYGIVKQSGGHVVVYSEPGHGATFKVYLPRVVEVAKPAPVQLPSEPLRRGNETILLVEDEEIVRGIAGEILERAGYTVLSAAGPDDALQIAQDYAGEIDLLLTDVVMPKMSGRDLAQRVSMLRPSAKVLYTSGYTDAAVVHHGVLGEGIAFLQKPFTRKALTRRVREILDDGSSSASETSLARPA